MRVLTESILRELDNLGEEVVRHNVNAVLGSDAPDGSGPQQENTDETQDDKLRETGTLTPLVGSEGQLADAGLYRVERLPWLVKILPPPERAEVIGYLRARGYTVFTFPPDIRVRFRRAIENALANARVELGR